MVTKKWYCGRMTTTRVSYLARTHGGGFSEQETITGTRPRTDISICALSSNPL